MDDAKELIAAIRRAVEDETFDLTEWEEKFIRSVSAQLREGRDLTDRQDEVLERIWRRALG